MAKSSSKVPVKKGESAASAPAKAATPAPVAVESARHPLVSLRTEIDRLFDDFASSFGRWPLGRSLFDERFWRMPELDVHVPVVDVAETDREYRVSAELPGMDEKDIEVTVDNDVLTIRGEKRQEKEEKKKGYRLSERRYGMFQRSFGLPAGVDASKIAADFSKGVLSVTLPKTAEAQKKQPRRIEVKGE